MLVFSKKKAEKAKHLFLFACLVNIQYNKNDIYLIGLGKMSLFYYIVSFKEQNDKFHIRINLEYANYLVSVFERKFSVMEKKRIFTQIFNYFSFTNIKMTKNELVLLYNTFKHDDFILPDLTSFLELTEDFRFSKGLTPKEMLFLMYISGKSKDARIAKYWEDEYQLDVDYTINRLIFLDYLTCSDFRYNLVKATKKELTKLLDQYNLSSNGSKAQLVQKIRREIPVDVQKDYFNGLYYNQTIKGEQIVLTCQHLNDFHKSYYRYANQLRIEEFYLLSKRFKDLDAKEVCKMMLDDNNKAASSFDWDKLLEIQDDKKLKDFSQIIEKHETSTQEVETKMVTDADFLNVVNKDAVQDKDVGDVFFQVVNKFAMKEKEDIKEQDVEGEKETDLTKLDADEIKNESYTEHYYEIEKPQNNFLFFKGFIYSSLVCILIVYIIYQFIFI